MRATATRAMSLAEAGPRRGLFPLAAEGDVIVLVRQSYGGLDKAGIASGALIGGVLWYTVGASTGRSFDLRRVDLSDPLARVRTVRTGLRHDQLHVYGRALVVDYRPAAASSPLTACDHYCLFSSQGRYDVTVGPNEDGDLEARVIDPVRGTPFGNLAGPVVGLHADSRGVDLYGDGLHKRIDVRR